jgi:hypothetical protein
MRAMGGREVSPEEAPELHTIVDRLCQLADSTKPRVAVSNSPIPNAFATGRSPERSVVCVTRGLLEKLDRDEVEVVLAHELSHVAHRDVTVMTVAGVTGVVAALMMRAGYYMSFGRSNNNNNGIPIQLLFILVGAVVYGLSFVLIRALSRYRELGRRPRRSHPHRCTVDPGVGADEAERGHGQDPGEGSAVVRLGEPPGPHPRDQRKGRPRPALLHPPLAREAPGAAGEDLRPALPPRVSTHQHPLNCAPPN